MGGLSAIGWGTDREEWSGKVFTRSSGETALNGCLGVEGGLFLGVRGLAAFWAVLVCLPGGGGGSLEPLLVA